MFGINPLRRSARLAAMAIQPSEPIVNEEPHLEKATKKARDPTPVAEPPITKEQKKEAQKMKRREKDAAEREERRADGIMTRRVLFGVSISSLVASIACVGGVVAIAVTYPWWAAVAAAVVGAAAVYGLFLIGGAALLMAGSIYEK